LEEHELSKLDDGLPSGTIIIFSWLVFLLWASLTKLSGFKTKISLTLIILGMALSFLLGMIPQIAEEETET
jgi:type IV secretory pathway TrbL component